MTLLISMTCPSAIKSAVKCARRMGVRQQRTRPTINQSEDEEPKAVSLPKNREVKGDKATSRMSSQEAQAIQNELRDNYRTRGRVQEANEILGSSPVNPNPKKNVRDRIACKELLQVSPGEFLYPVASASTYFYSQTVW